MEKQIKILVVEDEFIISDYIQKCLVKMGYLVVGICKNYAQALEKLQLAKPDLVLLDITLKGEKSGVDIAAYLKAHYKIPYIFVTSHGDKPTIDHAKQTAPFAYLIKPFDEDDLYAAIETALMQFGNLKAAGQAAKEDDGNPIIIYDSVFVKHRNQFVKLKLEDIEYIEANDNYVTLFAGASKYILRNTIKQMQESLPNYFFRTHRSYLINLKALQSFDTEQATVGNKTVPLSQNLYQPLLDRLHILRG